MMFLTCTMQSQIGLGIGGIMAKQATTDTWKRAVKQGYGDE